LHVFRTDRDQHEDALVELVAMDLEETVEGRRGRVVRSEEEQQRAPVGDSPDGVLSDEQPELERVDRSVPLGPTFVAGRHGAEPLAAPATHDRPLRSFCRSSSAREDRSIATRSARSKLKYVVTAPSMPSSADRTGRQRAVSGTILPSSRATSHSHSAMRVH
jgi:hypothetical protein